MKKLVKSHIQIRKINQKLFNQASRINNRQPNYYGFKVCIKVYICATKSANNTCISSECAFTLADWHCAIFVVENPEQGNIFQVIIRNIKQVLEECRVIQRRGEGDQGRISG